MIVIGSQGRFLGRDTGLTLPGQAPWRGMRQLKTFSAQALTWLSPCEVFRGGAYIQLTVFPAETLV